MASLELKFIANAPAREDLRLLSSGLKKNEHYEVSKVARSAVVTLKKTSTDETGSYQMFAKNTKSLGLLVVGGKHA